MGKHFHIPAPKRRLLPWVQRARAKGRSFVLLCTLVALLAIYPYVDRPGEPQEYGLRALTALVMLAAVYAVSQRRRSLVFALLLLLPAMFHNWLQPQSSFYWLMILGMVGGALFYLYTAGSVLAYVLRGSEITDDKVYGAINAYLLFGFAFASVYVLIDKLMPSSFVIYTGDEARTVLTNSEMLYFSFCTLTTTGFGDIAPRTHAAQSVAILESVGGVLYVAVIIARLVAGVHQRATEAAEDAEAEEISETGEG